jgi:hypothetical protein
MMAEKSKPEQGGNIAFPFTPAFSAAKKDVGRRVHIHADIAIKWVVVTDSRRR